MCEAGLQEVLEARERRGRAQRELLARYGLPVLSFTMNIPGPVKDSPLIRRGFAEGLRALDAALEEAGAACLSRRVTRGAAGNEMLCAVDAPAASVKKLCERIEDGSPMGRLFDMDVIGTDGKKLSRREERGCLVCGAAGRGCASRRLHGLGELTDAVTSLLREGLLSADAARADALATGALLDELTTTPKPGLVDLSSNGAHTDMTPETFRRSAEALRGYWRACFLHGARSAGEDPESSFAALRALGREAEGRMLAATGGVNTHKGVIFTLGTVCAAAGRLWTPESPCREPARIAEAGAALCSAAVERDFAALEWSGRARTAGERLYLRYGLRGIRGELAAGLPGVLRCALPALEDGLSEGLSRNDAGVYALLRLIARGEDTNMIKRGGMALAAETASFVRRELEKDARPSMAFVQRLDRSFIRQGLSPGGCADLLAVSFFLHDWKIERP